MRQIRNVEFLTDFETGVLMFRHNHDSISDLTINDTDIIEYSDQYISSRYNEAHARLKVIHIQSEFNPLFQKYRMVVRFCKCNFSKFDNSKFDIDENGIFNLEIIDCHLRGGDCPDEGIICKPKLTLDISIKEMLVFRAIKDGLDYEQTALLLGKSPLTIKRQVESLRKKTGVQSNNQLIAFWYTQGLM
jgi:DNA-binding HTH domain-containing proteins